MSESEPSLGLGLVVQVSPFQVQVLFPATGETRTYATDNAPLKRAIFSVGDEVHGCDVEPFVITAVEENDGVLTYLGDGCALPESALSDEFSVETPEARLLAGHTDPVPQFDLRLATLRHRHRVERSQVRGFTGARIELLPHQLFIAHEVCRRQLPRVLLADEVGLGKTIEACLILHRMLICGKAARVLVLLPEALVHQWFVELLRRFNLTFRIVDEDICQDADQHDAGNAFLDEQLVLSSVEFLVGDRQRTKQALAGEWDVLVVDEAHHLRWSTSGSSPEYELVEQLSAETPGLLLLTASPEQTGLESHFGRLRLLDPHRYADYQQFTLEHDRYESVAEQAAEVIAAGNGRALEDLLDRHGPGRVMFRNTRAAIAGFPTRVPHLIPLATKTKIAPDPRLQWLREFLRADPHRKVLVICGTAPEAIELTQQLQQGMAGDIAAFHEDMPLLQCDRQAAWFAEPEGPQVLVASGAGGEGRNFQFVNHLVLMDLPRDPELIEQRIGRLDRIGQKRDIHIHVPFHRDSPEEHYVRWLHEGLDAFSRPLVGGYQMALKFGDRLGSITDDIVQETRTLHEALCAKIEAGRDRLLELNSCRKEVAEGLVEAIRKSEDDDALEEYMLTVFEQFGVSVEPLGEHDYLLQADMLFCEEFPLPREQEAMRITYDRTHALSRPTITLMSWDHPIVHGAMDLILGSDRGSCAVARSSSVDGVLLQAVFVLEAVTPQRTEVESFLPPTPLLVQVDKALECVEREVTVCEDGDPWWVNASDTLRCELVPDMLEAARAIAEEQAPLVLSKAEAAMRNALEPEVERLRYLQTINDHIRQEELNAAEEQITDLSLAIQGARLRLDAVRFIIGNRE